MSRVMLKAIVSADQFNYIDGIDGPKTVEQAEKLGLSRNGNGLISKIWELKAHQGHGSLGWEIVNHEDWILTWKYNGLPLRKTVCTKDEFERTYEVVPRGSIGEMWSNILET